MRTAHSRSAFERRLRDLANPRRAVASRRFFKTGPGEYGAGDRFLGLTMPQVRAVAREARLASLAQLDKLLDSPWHEARMLALLVLVDQYARADPATQVAIYRLYLRRADRVNNWDLVDASAPGILGSHLRQRSRAILRRLARSRSLWRRRMAVIASLAFIRRGEYSDTLELAETLLNDQHDLMHKAVGWMLREVGARDRRALCRFLDRHAATMPRTALRYAIEHFSPRERRFYLDMGTDGRPAGSSGRRLGTTNRPHPTRQRRPKA